MDRIGPVLVEEKEIAKKFVKVVLERKFRLPNNEFIDYLVWGATVVPSIILPITQEQKVVAIRQFRYGANEFLIELPGGCPEQGELFEEISRKELMEETGFRAESFIKLSSFCWFEPAASTTPYFPILALGCSKVCDPKPDKAEFLDVLLYSVDEWIAKIYSGEVKDSKSIVVTFLALPRLGYEIRKIYP